MTRAEESVLAPLLQDCLVLSNNYRFDLCLLIGDQSL
jgi:hypothetical protein